jgi:ferrous iron transport protein B
VTALVSGFLAKEVVVSTLSTLFADVALTDVLTAGTALCLLTFCLLYTPCVAAIATIRRELGSRWALFVVALQCTVAWLVAFLVSLVV